MYSERGRYVINIYISREISIEHPSVGLASLAQLIVALNEEAGYIREVNSPNFRDFSRLAMATNIVLPLYKPKKSLNFFYNT